MIPQPEHTKSEAVAAPRALSGGGRTHLVSWALVVGFVALGVMFFFSDARKLWETASTLDWRLVLIPMLLGLASYALMALSYQGIAQAAGATVPFWEMLKITFVANTVNYVVSTGGLSGFAVRLYFFIRCSIASDLLSVGESPEVADNLISNSFKRSLGGLGRYPLDAGGQVVG